MNQKQIRLIVVFLIFVGGFICGRLYKSIFQIYSNNQFNVDLPVEILNPNASSSQYKSIDRFSSLLFIGGWPRSGTTLMRIILDVHKDIRCGPESHVIPMILEHYNELVSRPKFLDRKSIKLNNLKAAVIAYILEIIRRNGQSAKLLCDKDPMLFRRAVMLAELFPNAKFILMVRDGRAVTHSVCKRKVRISNVNVSDVWSVLSKWNFVTAEMYHQCIQLGSARCLIVKYEHLVLQTRAVLSSVVHFLGIEFDEKMLDHSSYLHKEQIFLNKFERSTDQVVYPISKTALYEWCYDKFLSHQFLLTAHKYASTLRLLNYDISRIPPIYL